MPTIIIRLVDNWWQVRIDDGLGSSKSVGRFKRFRTAWTRAKFIAKWGKG